jgi:hypothetical protein
MHLRPKLPYLISAVVVGRFLVSPLSDSVGNPIFAVEVPRCPDPIQPEEWPSEPSIIRESPSITTGSRGTTVTPGVGQADWTGYAPAVVIGPAAVPSSH